MSENPTVKGLLTEISGGLSQVSSSRKDEIRVMQAMLAIHLMRSQSMERMALREHIVPQPISVVCVLV